MCIVGDNNDIDKVAVLLYSSHQYKTLEKEDMPMWTGHYRLRPVTRCKEGCIR